jgi:hypothetical protein
MVEMGTGTQIAEWMRILELDMKNHVTVNISRHQGTIRVLSCAPLKPTARKWALTVQAPYLFATTITAAFQRWLIGIDEEGIFIKPALLARAECGVVTSLKSRLSLVPATPLP